MINIICKQCQHPFRDYPGNKRQFCSIECKRLYASLHPRPYHSKRLASICRYCQQPFTYYPSRVPIFCNSACDNAYRKAHTVSDTVASPRTLARRKKAAGLTKPAKRYFINEEFFLHWSDDLAWIVGLIWSDGYLAGSGINLCSKDKELLEKVAALIGHNIGPVPKNNGKHWRLDFSSKIVSHHLRTIGLHSAKSFTITWPIIPLQHEAAFVRGLLDGDGYVYLTKTRQGQQQADLGVGWCGASPLRQALERWLHTQGISFYSGIKKGTTVWKVNVYHHESLRHLYTLLYPTPLVPCLERKRLPFAQWITTPRGKAGNPRFARLNEHQMPLSFLKHSFDGDK